jgi:hypothetical protein
MNQRLSAICCAALAGMAGDFFPSRPATAADQPPLPVIGRSERVWIKDADAIVTARIDTGTRTSSLHADSIEQFMKKNAVWVRFTFRDDAGKAHTVERPMARIGTFKNNGLGTDTRPVVTLGLCIGKVYRRTQVNLVDRGQFNYRLLVGRRFLSNKVSVNTGLRLTVAPACKN